MKKRLIFYFRNKNAISNFYNYLFQINIRFNIFEIKKINFNHYKIVQFNDLLYKINQFVKISKKCCLIKKINYFKNEEMVKIFNYILNKKIKFFKKFLFIGKIIKYFILTTIKKNNYFLSILNNLYVVIQ